MAPTILTKPPRRPEVEAHPVEPWFALGVALTGVVILANTFFNGPLDESAAVLAFPQWLNYAFDISWVLSGALAFVGIVRCHPKLESAGWSLLSSALLANLVAVLAVRPQSSGSALFLIALAIGGYRRARYLTTHSS